MKHKLSYIFTVALIISFVLVWQYSNKTEEIISSINPVLIPVKEALLEVHQEKGFQQLIKKEKLEKTYQVLEQLPQEYKTLKRQYQIALSSLPNISFYGRVVDQYNQPVVDATVYYTGTNTYLSAGGGRGRVQTDEQGYFEIDTEGAELVLGGVSHKEIEYSHQQDSGLGREIPQGRLKPSKSFLSQQDNQGIYDSWRNYDEKDKAYIIHAWRLGKYDGAKSGNINGFYNRTGDTYTLNLMGKNYKELILKGEQQGHLKVSCTREPMQNAIDFGDWTANITPINGGVQETEDSFMNQAPETGYQSSIDIVMRKGSQDYAPSLINKRYYFKSNNGKEYGSLFVNFQPHGKYEDDRFCIIDITYKINPTGSRNLELKRDNTSQPKLPSPQSLARTRHGVRPYI